MSKIRDFVYSLPLSKPTQELILEALRWLYLAILSAIIVAAIAFVESLIGQAEAINEPLARLIVLGLLRAADKWLYAFQKENSPRSDPKGFTGF